MWSVFFISLHHTGELMCRKSNKQPLERPFSWSNDENVACGIERKRNKRKTIRGCCTWKYMSHYMVDIYKKRVRLSTVKDSFNFPKLRTSEITDGKKKIFFVVLMGICVRVCVCVWKLKYGVSLFYPDSVPTFDSIMMSAKLHRWSVAHKQWGK